MREDLTEKELSEFGTPALLDYLNKKGNLNLDQNNRKNDLFSAADNYNPLISQTAASGYKEKALKIHVGAQ
jgi:hypothetical protein